MTLLVMIVIASDDFFFKLSPLSQQAFPSKYRGQLRSSHVKLSSPCTVHHLNVALRFHCRWFFVSDRRRRAATSRRGCLLPWQPPSQDCLSLRWRDCCRGRIELDEGGRKLREGRGGREEGEGGEGREEGR